MKEKIIEIWFCEKFMLVIYNIKNINYKDSFSLEDLENMMFGC